MEGKQTTRDHPKSHHLLNRLGSPKIDTALEKLASSMESSVPKHLQLILLRSKMIRFFSCSKRNTYLFEKHLFF
jgi:hypothetical protein